MQNWLTCRQAYVVNYIYKSNYFCSHIFFLQPHLYCIVIYKLSEEYFFCLNLLRMRKHSCKDNSIKVVNTPVSSGIAMWLNPKYTRISAGGTPGYLALWYILYHTVFMHTIYNDLGKCFGLFNLLIRVFFDRLHQDSSYAKRSLVYYLIVYLLIISANYQDGEDIISS